MALAGDSLARRRVLHGLRRPLRVLPVALVFRAEILLDHDVGVRAGYAEGVDPRQPGPVGAMRPVHHGRRDLDGLAVPVEARVGVIEVQVLGYHPPPDGEDRLYQAGDTGGRLQVADVGLHRTGQQRSVGFTPPPVDVRHRVELDRVAHRRAGPVGLQVVDLRRNDACLRKRGLHHLFQGGRVRDGQAGACPAVIHGRAPDDRPDAVAVRLRLAQPLQYHDPASLAANIPVGGRVERLALPVGRQHHRLRAQLVDAPVQDGLDAAGNCQVRLAVLKVRHRVVHRDHGRSAGGIDRLGRSHETQHERDPAAGPIQVGAAEGVEASRSLRWQARVHDQHAVLVVADTRVYARAAPLQAGWVYPGVLEGLPGGLQHHPLLRVEELRLDGRNAEERRIELVDVVHERAVAARLVLDLRVADDFAQASLAGARNTLAYGVPALHQQLPEGLQVWGARELAGHAHDCYGFPAAGGPFPGCGP